MGRASDQVQVNLYMSRTNRDNVKAMAEGIGVTMSHLFHMALDAYMDGIEVPKAGKVDKVRQTQLSVYIPEDIYAWMEDEQERTKVSLASLVRVAVREHYKGKGAPQKKKPVRVARNPALSQRVMIESQAAMFDQAKKFTPEPDRIGGARLPNEVWLVTNCGVDYCELDQYEPHKHPNKLLGEYWARIDAKSARRESSIPEKPSR